MQIDVLPIGAFEENSYVIHHLNDVIFVDPGRHAKEIMKYVKDDENVLAIFLTHGHFDHTGAVDDLVDVYQCPIYISEKDFMYVDAEHPLHDGASEPLLHSVSFYEEDMTLGHIHAHIYETPGHTPGSVCIRNVPPYSVVMGNPAKVISFLMTPDEIVEYELKKYSAEERLPKEELEKTYNKYYINKIKEIKDFLK